MGFAFITKTETSFVLDSGGIRTEDFLDSVGAVTFKAGQAEFLPKVFLSGAVEGVRLKARRPAEPRPIGSWDNK